MPISFDAIEKMLSIKNHVPLTPLDMAKNLSVTFFPQEKKDNTVIENFKKRLEVSLNECGVKIIPYHLSLRHATINEIVKRLKIYFKIQLKIFLDFIFGKEKLNLKYVSFSNFFNFCFSKKINKNIAIFVLGDNRNSNLPINLVSNLKDNPIITVVDSQNIHAESWSFNNHMDYALKLFSYYMTNLAISVNEKKWTIYSFNLSHPEYNFDENFSYNILNSLIPKIAAPVAPPKLNEFEPVKSQFNINDAYHKVFVEDIVKCGKNFGLSKLFPKGKKIKELSFRNYFYQYIGNIHLDQRNGMSYGFLSRQLPTKLNKPVIFSKETLENYDDIISKLNGKDYFIDHGGINIIIEIKERKYLLKIPDIWVLTSKSGANKTNLNPDEDIIKMGLVNGKMLLETPIDLNLNSSYKPSFDTKIIFSHALAKSIFASFLKYFDPKCEYAKQIESNGISLAHWHGYIRPDLMPDGWVVFGEKNPSVSCSAPQAAIYAFQGLEKNFENKINKNDFEYFGDIHIEPHHGINISFSSLLKLSEFIINNDRISKLGNEYFDKYYH